MTAEEDRLTKQTSEVAHVDGDQEHSPPMELITVIRTDNPEILCSFHIVSLGQKIRFCNGSFWDLENVIIIFGILFILIW